MAGRAATSGGAKTEGDGWPPEGGAALADACRGTAFHLFGEGDTWRAALSFATAPSGVLDATRGSFLSPAENALLTARLHPRRRRSLLLGRLAAKHSLMLLGPSWDPRGISILPGVLQQPVVSGAAAQNLQVSVAHSGSLGCAVAFPEACPMGLDLERILPGHATTLASQTTWAERKLAKCLPGTEEDRLTRLWSLKEALSKALRCGLTVPFPLLELSRLDLEPGAAWAEFGNFGQYRGLSLKAGRWAFALVLPRTVQASLDPALAAAWLAAASELEDGI